MESAKWADILAQAIFHTLVASLFVEALVRSWRVTHPGQRMALRLTALGYPLVLFPALVLAFPARADEGFQDRAIFVARRWEDLHVFGVGLFTIWLGLFAGLGALLFLMDLVPLVRGRRRPRLAERAVDGPEASAVAAELPALAAVLVVPTPPVIYLDRDAPVLFCTGVRRPAIVVSRGTVALLDPEELRAALAHELAHLAGRDPLKSWVAMGARALMCLNPAFQVVARAIARDAERVADERAAHACGDRLALASGLLKLHRATLGGPAMPRTLPFAATLAEPLARVRSHDIELRCRGLLGAPPAPLPWGRARLLLAGAALTALLFFVV